MKKETVDEFLARGGKIQVIPPQQVAETPHTLKVSSTPENRILTLDDGEFYFSESRKTSNKKPIKNMLKDIVDNFNLPKEIKDRLRGSNDE